MSLRIGGLLSVCALGAASARAGDDIASTKHNLSTHGWGDIRLASPPDGETEKDQICVFCHTPHHGDMDVGVVLWNRRVNEGAYRMYDSGTLDMDVASQPQSVSLACLSCHDGAIAFDALRNGPGAGDYDGNAPSRGWSFRNGDDKIPGDSYGHVDSDLSNDHPVSITFDDSQDTAFYDMGTVRAEGLKFFEDPRRGSNDQVECASCHNPHSADHRPFLRKSNQRSELCLTCHIK